MVKNYKKRLTVVKSGDRLISQYEALYFKIRNIYCRGITRAIGRAGL